MGRVPELPRRDLDHVLEHAGAAWRDLRGARVYVTGVTGFIGSWLLESLLHANRALGLDVAVTALVRDPGAFASRFPHLNASPALRLETGDVRDADPTAWAPTHFVHCASAASPRVSREQPGEVEDLIERGTARMVESAERTRARFLHVSSGSVYGPQPSGLAAISESFTGEPDARDPTQRYAVSKRTAERRGAAAVEQGVGFVSARVFALVGPRLPLDGQFALGQFLADALAGRPVTMTGDGSPLRSWMYAADLAAWCWVLLARGRAGEVYNVGSEEVLSIGDASARIARLPVTPVTVVRQSEPHPTAPASRYVPSTRRARDELGLEAWTRFDESLARTWQWLRA